MIRRRELLAAAAAAAVARPSAALAAGGDAAIVEDLIAREDAAALAHRIAAVAPGIAAAAAAHAAALRTELAGFVRHAPPPPERPGDLDGPARRLAEARTAEAAIALEAALAAACREAVIALAEPSILRTTATILAGHAQSLALLRRRNGRDPLA